MAYHVKVLRTKAEKFERKELQNYRINPKQMSALDEMLHNVYAVRRPKSSDYDVRRDLVRVFNDIAKELYGNTKEVPVIVEFGSFSMDIFNAKSDLDLSVNFGNRAGEVSREKKIQTLRKFAKKFYALQSKGHVTSVLPITTAKVPILKVVDRGTGVECDISVENRDGISKSQILNMISSIDGRFRELSFLMKAWAKEHNINSSKDKTLNSLSIVLLVAFHLQTRNPPVLPPFSLLLKDGSDPTSVMRMCREHMNFGRSNKETVAELFVSLLIKLSAVEKLWSKGLCASVYEACWVSKTWDSKIACISVEDFTDRSQNVARAVGTSEVKSIFKCIQLSTRRVCTFMDGHMEGSVLMELLFGRDPMPTPAVTGLEAMPPPAQPMPSNPVLTKRKQPVEDWARPPTGSSTRPPAENYVQPHSTKRVRQAEDLGEVHAGGWGQTSNVVWVEPKSTPLLLVPPPSALPFVHLQNQVPPPLSFPYVHPASSRPIPHPHQETNHWSSTSYVRR